MKCLILIALTTLFTACSSSQPAADSTPPPAPADKTAARPSGAPKRFTPAKTMKCKFDTDCVVLDSCVSGKCKIGANECRFRSDCPSPRGVCVSDKCEF